MFYFLLLVLSTLLGLTNSVYAATYWVAKTGRDSNTCAQARSESTPKLTIAAGTACLSVGDTLMIKDGDYSETPTFGVSGGGTEGSRTIYKAQNPLRVVVHVNDYFEVRSNWITIEGLVFDLSGVEEFRIGVERNGQEGLHVRLRNSEVRNAGSNCLGGGSGVPQWLELINLHVHDCGKLQHCDTSHPSSTGQCHGIYISSHNNLIEGGNWHHCSFYGGQCLHLYSGGWSHSTVRNMVIHDNLGIAIGSYYGTNNYFYNNIIYNTYQGLDAHDTNSFRYNNTIYNNRDAGIVNGSGKESNTFRNNIVFNNAGGSNNIEDRSSGATFSNNLCNSTGGGCTHRGNPNFVNVGSNDFHLQSGSAAIDAGQAIGRITEDCDGISRPQGSGYDIGAYEYSVGQVPPPSPSNLRIVSR